MIIQALRPWGVAGFLVMISSGLTAQHCDITLRGRVWNADSGEPLPYAAIHIVGTPHGAISDAQGAFSIANLCEDSTYVVKVSHIECRHETQVLRLTENKEFNFYLHHHVLAEIVVKERAIAPAPAQAVEQLSAEQLAQRQSGALGEALRQLPGVAVLNTGTTIAKPVIHGLHSNRIAIVSDRLVLEGQQWGAEHAPEIDLFTAHQVSVVKGAAGVRYGVGAMAGAVVLEPKPLRSHPGWGGWGYVGLNSNGLGTTMAGAVEWKPAGGSSFSTRLQGTLKRSGNLRAPDYWLGNTGAAEINFSAWSEWETGAWRHEAALSRFAQRIGILQAAHIGNLTDLRRAIESPLPLNNDDRFTYAIDRPFQRIQHYTLRYRASRAVSDRWKLSAQYALQFNHREEYDIVRRSGSAANKPQQRFRLWTHTADLALEHSPLNHWEGGIGAQLLHQFNLVGRGGLIPDYSAWGGSLWVLERWRHYPKPWEVEVGLRYDYRHTAASTTGALYNIDTAVHFGSLSGNFGLIRRMGKHLRWTLNSGYAWRPPHVNELFARGVHHGAATYEEGRPDLRPEKAWNTNMSAQYEHHRLQATLTVFRNRVKNFIYLDPQRTLVLTSRGAFPAYFYAQANAVLYGLDASAALPLAAGLVLEARSSCLRAYRSAHDSVENATRHDWLPLMPSDRFQYGLYWSTPGKDVSSDAPGPARTYARLTATTALRQVRLPQQGLLQEAPPAFTLWSFEAGHTFSAQQGRNGYWEVGLLVRNLANLRYREYLNFFRFFADEPGLNIGCWGKRHF